MDFLNSMKISSSGLAANRKRMNVISSNIANAQTTRTIEGGPYRPKEVVFGSELARESFSEIFDGQINSHSVHATEIINLNKPPLPKYEPNHPDAGPKGYVYYPNINIMTEMANMISASRAYEANINAFNTSKAMAQKALEIGK
ncbi:MAG: flagellar basal body rod protein FlgC [Bacteriovoracales bacterium]|nr:flagellar basal body rod protein FlgC [Bacteriovoracales bacterium]